jgi:integrase
MRHTFGSLLINVGEPVTYVSRQLGHKDSAITLKVYARWLQDDSRRRGVDRLDETHHPQPPRNLRGKLRSVKIL